MKYKAILLTFFLVLTIQAQDKPQEKVASNDNDTALREFIQRSAGSQTELIKNLEAYLQQYSKSEHRTEIESATATRRSNTPSGW
jgi:predicted lipoprotein